MAKKKRKPNKSAKAKVSTAKQGQVKTPPKKNTPPTPPPNKKPVLPETSLLPTKWLWAMTAGAVLFFFLFSLASQGFLQQDEAAHFVSMKRFWYNPNGVLSNWEKPGFKLVFAIPGLFGATFVKFVNCCVAALSCFFAYRVAAQAGARRPILAFILLLTQPLFVQMAFRNYAEILTGFLLILGVFFHQRKQFMFSALAMSYIVFMRQEFYPLLGLYFLWLAYHKQFIPALLTGTFTLVHNTWGAIAKGEPLYLVNQILNTSSEIGKGYPRHGFEHYPLMSVTVFGGVCVALFVGYLGLHFLRKRQPDWVLVTPTLLYLLMYSIFNIQTFEIGPATAGNLRYLVSMAPLVAVIAALFVDELHVDEKPGQLLYIFGPLSLLVLLFMTYDHNFVLFNENVRDFKPLIGVLFVGLFVVLPLKYSQKVMSVALLAGFTLLITVKFIPVSEEDNTMNDVAKWYEANATNFAEKKLYNKHNMLYYYLERTPEDFAHKVGNIRKDSLEAAPSGSLILWESHYSYRPELMPEAERSQAVTYKYFTEQPAKYKLLRQFRAKDNTFAVLIFEKK